MISLSGWKNSCKDSFCIIIGASDCTCYLNILALTTKWAKNNKKLSSFYVYEINFYK